MKLIEIMHAPFSLELKTPFNNSSSSIDHRNGFMIKCFDDKGNIGVGECSPLPGFSKESLSETEDEIKTLTHKFCGTEVPYNLSEIQSYCANKINIASVRFGFEQAIFNLVANANPFFILQNFPYPKSIIDVNAVIGMDDVNRVLTQAKLKVMDGYKTIKLKIGREDPFEDFYLITTLRNVIGYDFKLRLDANKNWSSDEAIEYMNRLDEYMIEYIEEPCGFLSSNFRACDETHVPVALDESIESIEHAYEVINSSSINYLIIKPTILGEFFSVFNLIKTAEDANKRVIISSSFESEVGKSGLVFLSSLTKHDSAHGLDTVDYFTQPLYNDPYAVQGGIISFDPENYPPRFSL